MAKKEKIINIFIKLFLIVLVIGLIIGAIFLGKYLAELRLKRNGNIIYHQNTNITIPLKTE